MKIALGGTMADQSVIQVSRLLDERGLSSFQIKRLIWSFSSSSTATTLPPSPSPRLALLKSGL
jgi:hypothetical protein